MPVRPPPKSGAGMGCACHYRVDRIAELWRRLRQHPRALAMGASLGAFVALLFLFSAISDAALDDDDPALALDVVVLRAMRSDEAGLDPIGPYWLERAVADLSALGSGAIISVIVVITVALLLLVRRRLLAYLFAGASLGAWGIMALLKEVFGRPRPDIITPSGMAAGHSFPSGHALIATAVFVLLGMLLSRVLEPKRLRWSVILIAAVLALLVGLTRVYLGVHFPTDVLAGWTAGLAWASLCGASFLFLESRGLLADRSGPVRR